MRKLLVLPVFFVLLFSVYAEDLPKPYAWVNDFAQVINSGERDKLNSLIQELENKTSAEIFIVTKDSITPYDEKAYARLLFDSWKPGKKGKDNGILMLLAVKERRWRIETGYGLEGILPDSLCGEIGRSYMVPYFKNGQYGAGFYHATTRIAKIIASDAQVKLANLEGVNLSTASASKTRGQPPTIFLCLFGFFFFLVWNLPWPIFIGLPFTLIFAAAFFSISKLAGSCVVAGYIASMIIRYRYWHGLPPGKRTNFFGNQSYGGKVSSGGFGGGGFSGGGFGGGGGGCGGGGGAGGGF